MRDVVAQASRADRQRDPDRPDTREFAPDWMVDRLEQILLTPTGGFPDAIQAAMAVMEPRGATAAEPGDILTTHVFGFPAARPHVFTNTANRRMGMLFEQMVLAIYEAAHPHAVSRDWASLLEGCGLERQRADKARADFHLGDVAYEIKYRHNSGEGLAKQQDTVRFLHAMGLRPVMLCLRASPNAAKFRSAGWTVHEGSDTLATIRADTGFDLSVLVDRLGARDAIQSARLRGWDAMRERVATDILERLDANPDIAARVMAALSFPRPED